MIQKEGDYYVLQPEKGLAQHQQMDIDEVREEYKSKL